MKKKIIRVTPDDLGYKERGKMKWQGLILADQTEALKRMWKEDNEKYPEAKPLMSMTKVAEVLQRSYVYKRPVSIQANTLRNGHLYPDVECVVQGVQDEDIYLKLKDGKQTSCKIEQIRNIEFMNIEDWYNNT